MTPAICCFWLLTGQPVAATSVDFMARRDDGSLIHWSLDRQRGGQKQGILVLAQGSGCLAATENANILRAKGLLPTFAVVMVEKYGVGPHDKPKDPFGNCSAAFYAHHTISQRVADYERVLRQVETSPWSDGRVVFSAVRRAGRRSRCWLHASRRQRPWSSPRRLAGEVMQRIAGWLVANVSTRASEGCPPPKRSDQQ